MNLTLNRLTGIALGCLTSLAIVGCASKATEPPQRNTDATPVMAPTAPTEPIPQVVVVAPPGPVVEPLVEGNAMPSSTTTTTTAASPTFEPAPAPATNLMIDELPPRADRN